jgi:signal transduction histidine kinase
LTISNVRSAHRQLSARDSKFAVTAAAGEIGSLLTEPGSTEDRRALRELVLAKLRSAGFERARFYERCADNARDGMSILVLVAEDPPSASPDGSNVGYHVDDEDSILGYDLSKQSVFTGDSQDFSEPPEWYERFDMEGRKWVDIALRASDEVVGVLALDWSDDRRITDKDKSVLTAIGLMVGSHLHLRPRKRVREFRDALGASIAVDEPETPSSLIVSSAEIIGHALEARLAAVFEYVWTTGKLNKRVEIDLHTSEVSGDGQKREFFTGKEVWRAGDRLTGHAWEDARFHHIPVFEHLEDHLADEGSKQRHADYMGEEVNTCLYGFIGGAEPRYMLRFINRTRGGFMPFVGEADLLGELLAELRSDLDTSIAVARTRNLEYAARVAAEASDPGDLMGAIAPLLGQEGVDNVVFLCHQRGSPQFAFHGGIGPLVSRLRWAEGEEWEEDDLYARLASEPRKAVGIVDSTSRSTLALHLSEEGFDRVVSLPISVGETAGTLLIPTGDAPGVENKSLVKQCGASRLNLLHAYGRLAGDVVDSSIAHQRAEGARQALGVLGHELASPLARLGSAAEQALRRTRDGAVEIQRRHGRRDWDGMLGAADRVRSTSVASLEKVGESRRSVAAAMSLAPIVAKETNGRLELQFREFNLGELVFKTIGAIRQEMTLSFDAPRGRTYRFEPGNSILRLRDTVGEEALLQHALLNLLRNAAKYSMTPGHGSSACKITIEAERQTNMNIIVVKNWGRGILHEQMDAIFQPWTRFDEDADVARRGMGLGLFLARRIALAHGGSVVCRKSEPTLNDINRQAQLEGYETEFELRLPKGYEEGAYVHTWHAGDPVRPPERKPDRPLQAMVESADTRAERPM